MKKVLVTGSSGFTGKHLIRYLKQIKNLELVGLDINPDTETRFCKVDLLDRESTRSVLESEHPDYLIHLSGLNKSENAENFYKLNVFSTINVLESIISNNLLNTKLLFISTSAVYGRISDSVVSESSETNPVNFYGSSKLSMETVVNQYSMNYDLSTHIVRPFNLVGPGQNVDFVIPNFINQLLKIKYGLAEPVLHTGNLSSARDFVDVRDAVEAYWMILEKGNAGEVYNLSSGTAIPIRDILNKIIDMVETPSTVTINERPPLPGEIPVLTGDSTKLRTLGWNNKIKLDDSILNMITSLEQLYDK